jgi:ornithine cyclodeaminase/alanine dehydrogenase-like protein (mu-crystallin family)
VPDLDIAALLTMPSIPRHDRTLYKSVGVATMDVAAAAAALRNAEYLGIGMTVDV